MGDILKNIIITPEDFEFLKSIGVPCTGYVKGIGYTCPVYMPAQGFRVIDGNVQWNTCELYPLFYQAIDDSPEHIFFSMGYTAEDIAKRITHDNGDGTITINLENQSVTFPKEQSKVNVCLNQEGGNYFICVEATDSKGNILLSDSKIIRSCVHEKGIKQDFDITDELGFCFNGNKEILDNINTGIGAFGVGVGAKTELIDYGVRSFHGYSWKQFNSLSEKQKLIKETKAIGKTGTKYLRGTKIFGKWSSYVSAGYSVSLIFVEDGRTWEKKTVKAALDVGFTYIGTLGPWGFAISSIYYLVDTATDGFGYFNE